MKDEANSADETGLSKEKALDGETQRKAQSQTHIHFEICLTVM